ncbi:hypothetical protein [Roseicyclus sp.]|uniref:hypothetical protein n=1 Tax=Roseicyclus sp. TaxID=1914329 RepID=UPI003FA10F3B
MADRKPTRGERTDSPGYTPDADRRPIGRGDRRRAGALGGFLVFALPVLILAVAFFMWWSRIGLDGPAVDAPAVVPAEDAAPPATE